MPDSGEHHLRKAKSRSCGAADGQQTPNTDISDEATIQNTPEWTFNAGINYARPLQVFGSPGTLSVRPRVAYRSKTNQFEISAPLLDQPGYTLIDLSVVWTLQDDRWQVGVHGKNLTDKEYIIAGWDFVDDETLAPELGLEGVLTAFYGNPRTVTGALTYRF